MHVYKLYLLNYLLTNLLTYLLTYLHNGPYGASYVFLSGKKIA